MFNNKTILITGGTGSFGQKFVQTLLTKYSPKTVIVYSRDELKQYEMQQLFPSDRIRFVLGDVRDRNGLIKATRGVDYVVHSAALKQIPIAERNPVECIKTNINGAQNIIDAALTNNVKKVVALSTDKAVLPVSLYGATKLAADKLFIAANSVAGNDQTTLFSVVRYGNVINTRGSVIPYFRKLIQKNSPYLPITDNRMTRFWISLEQGIDAVISAFNMMNGGEIFVPKTPSIRIIDLASAMAPGLPQKIIGIRPGEKIHEVLCPSNEAHLTYEFSDHFMIISENHKYFQNAELQINTLGEIGKKVPAGFEYNSNTNNSFLSTNEIILLHEQIGLSMGIDTAIKSCV